MKHMEIKFNKPIFVNDTIRIRVYTTKTATERKLSGSDTGHQQGTVTTVQLQQQQEEGKKKKMQIYHYYFDIQKINSTTRDIEKSSSSSMDSF